MRCSSCNHLIVAGGLHPGDGVFCGNRCFRAYRQSRARLAAGADDAPPAPQFTIKEALIYGLLIGICGNFAVNDLARRQSPVEEADATEAMQAQKLRAMEQVRGYDSLSEQLLAYFTSLAQQGRRLANFEWSATRSGRGTYRVRVGFSADNRYRALSWRVNLSERTVEAEDPATAAISR